jgi:hypothetical protein
MKLNEEILRIKVLMLELNTQNNPNKMVKGELYYKYMSQLITEYPDTPELVLSEFLDNRVFNDEENVKRIENTYYGDITIDIRGYNDWFLSGPWELKTLELSINDFNRTTKQGFIDREFGDINPYMVPDDKERMSHQMKKQTGKGENVPVILVQDKGGYELVEGWHRVMAILRLGDNGGSPETWRPQLINAYVHL